MEKKDETITEMNPEQMAGVSGGRDIDYEGEKAYYCPKCGAYTIFVYTRLGLQCTGCKRVL